MAMHVVLPRLKPHVPFDNLAMLLPPALTAWAAVIVWAPRHARRGGVEGRQLEALAQGRAPWPGNVCGTAVDTP
jgi:hypothetical protein